MYIFRIINIIHIRNIFQFSSKLTLISLFVVFVIILFNITTFQLKRILIVFYPLEVIIITITIQINFSTHKQLNPILANLRLDTNQNAQVHQTALAPITYYIYIYFGCFRTYLPVHILMQDLIYCIFHHIITSLFLLLIFSYLISLDGLPAEYFFPKLPRNVYLSEE